ncbi:MAG: heavy metal translocating P-type ATPase [Syntrophomonadaceae bacterium]|nr:heavy metal translocating P-type ATPase [Syntrophomonadaceae bacterium]
MVIDAQLAFSTGKLNIRYQGMPGVDKEEQVINLVKNMGYEISSDSLPVKKFGKRNFKSRVVYLLKHNYSASMLLSGLALVIVLLAIWLHMPGSAVLLVIIIGIAAGIYRPALTGWYTLHTLRELDMNALMVIAVIGAAIIGEYQEALAVVFLFSLGNFLQVYTFDKTRNSIRTLMDLSPREALVRRNGKDYKIPVTELEVGDLIIISPGETIAADGMVLSGSSTVNQAAITGESVPVFKEPHSEVFAGTINQYGSLEIKVTREYKDTTLQQIITMVEQAQSERAPSQQLIDRFARWYTPTVIILAIMVAIIPPLLMHQPWYHWIYMALAMLLVACPCALVISTPVAIVSAIGNAARQGVLIKGGSHLEELGSLSVIAFDKTGTLTEGKLEVVDLISLSDMTVDKLLTIAAGIENRSEHPLASAIIRKAEIKAVTIPPVSDFQAVPGKGANGIINEQRYHIGNLRYFDSLNLDVRVHMEQIASMQNEGKTVVLIGNQLKIIGIISLMDNLRPDIADVTAALRKSGIKQMVMLTGDNHQVAATIANNSGLDSFYAELLPDDKLKVIEQLLADHRVAMVGDGINDAPALARATVGIAMGTAGTDVALETADIALMSDDLSRLPFAIRLSRQTLRIIKQNIAFSLLFKTAILLMIIPGLLTMLLAVVGDVGTSILVTLNGMRLLRKT